MSHDGARHVVVLDTDQGVRWALDRGLTRSGYRVSIATTVGEAVAIATEETVDALVLEMLPEAGLTEEALSMVIDTPSAPRVVCVSVDAEPHTVIGCMRLGAADFVPKPFSLGDVRSALQRALKSDNHRGAVPKPAQAVEEPETEPSYLIGISPAMQELRDIIKQVSHTDLNCLIRGESGTGKDMVARELHRLSRRSQRPFVKVNCTALPEHLLESELFGYEKGAFTGAATSKPGRFELAHRGIIFLDEIGDMHPNLQAKLLQVIEHKEFTKLGGRRAIHVDVQIIAATNVDLEERTKQGLFRDDLYFRLNEVCVWVPPLSARKEDIPLLVRHFIQKHGRYTGREEFRISGDELQELTEHRWPGNVRELESTIKRWLALGNKELPRSSAESAGKPAARSSAPSHDTPSQPGEPTPDDLREALERNRWNRRQAARELGISYQTLRRRIEKHGLNRA